MASRSPKSLLETRGLRAKRSFGQNFLTDPDLAARIAELATAASSPTVIEIGAGLGALTRPLLDRAERVIAVERDRDLIPVLLDELAAPISSGKLVVREADAKALDYLIEFEGQPRPHVIAGNLPYQITGPLLETFTTLADSVQRIVCLVQLEVAQRLVARPGTATYGALTVFVQAQFRPKRAFNVRRGAFYPQPGVDSAVIVLEPLESPVTRETETFRALVRAAFGQRRKKLRNAWQNVPSTDTTIETAAHRAGLDLERRGEALSVEDFARMAREVDPT